MMDYGVVFVFGIVLATIIFSFVSAKGGLSDNRRKWYTRLTSRGWFCALLGAIIIVLSIWQFIYSTSQTNSKEILLRNEERARDLLIKAGIDSSNKVLFLSLASAFEKQNLRFDSSRKEVVSFLKDSLSNSPMPDLNFCAENGITLDTIIGTSLSFHYNLCNLLGVAKNIKLKLYSAILNEDGTYEFIPNYLTAYPYGQVFSVNRQHSSIFRIDIKNKKIDKFYFLLVGSYTNVDGSKSISLKSIRSYNLKNKIYGMPNIRYSDVEKVFQRNGALK